MDMLITPATAFTLICFAAFVLVLLIFVIAIPDEDLDSLKKSKEFDNHKR